MDLYHLIKILFSCFSSSQRSHVSGEDFVSLKKRASDPNVRFAFTWSCLSYLHQLCLLAHSGAQRILCCVFCFVCPRLVSCSFFFDHSVSLDCSFFIDHSVSLDCSFFIDHSVSLDCSFFIDHSVSLTFIVILLSKCLNYIHVKRERRLDHKPQRYTFI